MKKLSVILLLLMLLVVSVAVAIRPHRTAITHGVEIRQSRRLMLITRGVATIRSS